MKKILCITCALAAGLAICAFAPMAWRLVGAFLAGGACFAILQMLKLRRIEQEILRYEQPPIPEPATPRELTLPIAEPDPRPGLNLHGGPEPLMNAAA